MIPGFSRMLTLSITCSVIRERSHVRLTSISPGSPVLVSVSSVVDRLANHGSLLNHLLTRPRKRHGDHEIGAYRRHPSQTGQAI